MSAARRSWALCFFTCACMTVYAGLYLTGDSTPYALPGLDDAFPFVVLGVVAGAVVGALILSRYPRNRIGWLLSIGQAGAGLGSAAGAYASRVLTQHDLGPPAAGHVAAWVWHFFGAAYALPLTCALFLLVPDGRLPSRRWRPVMAALVVSYLLYAGALLTVRPVDAGLQLEETPMPAWAREILGVSGLPLFVGIVGAAAALVQRLRRSTGVQRQQLRWIMVPAGLLAVGAAYLFVYQQVIGPNDPWYAVLPLYIGYAAVPICTGIAILRYRLYDIDVIVSRAFVLAVLATFVTVGYVAVVVVVGAALGTRVDERFWPSLLALVLVALAFQPLRRHVMKAADRLVYGQRAAPYEALADFSRRLGGAPQPARLLPRLAEAVARGVGADHAWVSLDVPDGAAITAVWPADTDRVADFAVQVVDDRREPLGRIALTMPPGRGLRRPERRLLEDIAAQAGLAFRNLRLEAELRARVDQVARQSAELAASRRRLLAARDHERRRTADIIDRRVLAHLRQIPPGVASLDIGDPVEAEATLRRLEAATDAGLVALRDVTRGVFPVLLAHRGLATALRAYAATIGRGDVLSVAPAVEGRRFPRHTEAAAYFLCADIVRDLTAPARLGLTLRAGRLVIEASGTAPDLRRRDGGPYAAVDRVEAVGGRLCGAQEADGRVTLTVEIPVDQDDEASVQTAASRSVPKADLAM
jgi:hypothetical protein